jgi:serine/threonine protein kinase
VPHWTDRSSFVLCLAFGRLLRAGRYASVRIVDRGAETVVRKHRLFHAPLLVSLGDPLVRILDAGVRVLPQRDWEERERLLYQRLYDAVVSIEAGGTLVLPCLPGKTLASLLKDPALEDSLRHRAIQHAVVALAHLHHLGFTHGDAMAENVMVDLDAGVARWFDFETVHEPGRPLDWRRADDLRALLATCLLRTPADQIAVTLQRILDVYPHADVTRRLASCFTPASRRTLVFHLGQAALSYRRFREIDRLLRERLGE